MDGAGNPARVVGPEAGAGAPTATAAPGNADVTAPAAAELGMDDGLPSATAGVVPDGEKAYSGGSLGDKLANLVFRSDSTAAAALGEGAKITG